MTKRDDNLSDPIAAAWKLQRTAMGAFIRSQRKLANMSLRELSRTTRVSNAYLSQIERGLHDPTLRVLAQIAEALNLSIDEILARYDATDANAADDDTVDREIDVETAIARDPALTDAEKEALRAVYRSYVRGVDD